MAGTVDSLIQQRSTAAAPLYEEARKLKVAPSEELSSIVEAAHQLGADQIAKKIATAERQSYTLAGPRVGRNICTIFAL